MVFFDGLSNYKKIYKNYRKELISVLSFNLMSTVRRNIAHTTYHFLLEVLRSKHS